MRGKKEHQPRKYNVGVTSKEQETLPFIAQGMTNAQIARKLGISQQTVGQRINSLYNKLVLSTRNELVAYAKEVEAQDQLPDTSKKIEVPETEFISTKQFVSEVFPGLLD